MAAKNSHGDTGGAGGETVEPVPLELRGCAESISEIANLVY